MTAAFKKNDRVAARIQRKLSVLIKREVDDPRLTGFVTISHVQLSTDAAYAKVYFTVFGQDPAETAEILNAAASLLRTGIARTSTTRTVPKLQFIYDESMVYGQELVNLIDKVNAKNSNDDKT